MPAKRRRRNSATTPRDGAKPALSTGKARSITASLGSTQSPPDIAARDEALWGTFRQAFTPEPGHAWFNCFAFNPAPISVHEAFLRNERTVNAWPLAHLREVFGAKKREALRARLAQMVNALPEEIALLRNTTEAISNVIFGLDLARGDEVVITNQDYGTFLDAWTQRERREGIVLRQITLPVPAPTLDALVEAFRKAITSRTRVIMCSHIADPTGQIFPIRAIADAAHGVGAQVVVDGALGFGCIPVDVKALDCDYYGTSLHKGVFAPTGTGFLYVRRDRIRSLWPILGAPKSAEDDIRKLEYRGTAPVTALAAVDDALDFYDRLGPERMAARYRYLKRRWADRVATHPRCRLSVRLEPEHSCGIETIAIQGVDLMKLCRYLDDKGISTWPIGIPAFPALWISPYPFTTSAEVDALAEALLEVAERGLPH